MTDGINMPTLEDIRVAVIGLGYVGLPLAVEFGKNRRVVGFDIDRARIEALEAGTDSTLEVTDAELSEAKELSFSSNPESLLDSNCYIICEVPEQSPPEIQDLKPPQK